jgi:hypothetical protein
VVAQSVKFRFPESKPGVRSHDDSGGALHGLLKLCFECAFELCLRLVPLPPIPALRAEKKLRIGEVDSRPDI